jgi:Protein tyrosine and serine/threonine kinase
MTSPCLEPYYSDTGLYGTYSTVHDCISTKHHDLISFLALMQHCGVDFLPIKWQPALEDLGRGGSADVSQALINSEMSFAFKRVFFAGRSTDESFRRLTTEVLVLRNRLVQGHPNIIRLEAYCCEILTGYERLSPVLIFEKAHLGDLQCFVLSEKATEIPFDVKVGLCSDIAEALHVLHSNRK